MVLNILKNYMLMTMTLLISIVLVRVLHLVSSIGMMVTCFEKIEFVCLNVLCESYWLKKHIVEA